MTHSRFSISLQEYWDELNRVNWHPELEKDVRGSNLAMMELSILRQYRILSQAHKDLFDAFFKFETQAGNNKPPKPE